MINYTFQVFLKGIYMRTKTVSVNRWGNGLGIRLPKEFVDKVGITETSRVEVSEADGRLVIARSKEILWEICGISKGSLDIVSPPSDEISDIDQNEDEEATPET